MTLELHVGGRVHGGWMSARVTRSIEQLASSFELQLTERWVGSTVARPVRAGQSASLVMDGETVISGYVDEVTVSTDENNSTVRVTGRSRAGDLVDCSAQHPSGRWEGAKLADIARDLCKPFGIGVTAADAPPFRAFALEQGETVFTTLERAARMRAFILTSTARGNLVIGRAGGRRVPVRLDDTNVKRATFRTTSNERFAEYVVKAQQGGVDEQTADDATQGAARSKDAGVGRYRPLVVLLEDQGDLDTLQTRANWERNVRAGRSRRLTAVVQGWQVEGSTLWAPNILVRVQLPRLELDRELLIVSVAQTLDGTGGTLTELQLAPRSAYDVLAEPEKEEGGLL